MTYKHKRGKCAKETKEILEDVLRFKEEEYGCIDCTETVKVSNPIEKIISEETPKIEAKELRSQAETAMEESELQASDEPTPQIESLESYAPPKDIGLSTTPEAKTLLDKEKKKRAYMESKNTL